MLDAKICAPLSEPRQDDDSCRRANLMSLGGLTSKIHRLVDAERRPVDPRLSGGQVHNA